MRIQKLQLSNIGVFKNTIVDFPECEHKKAEIHVFTGVNGSGKSTLLKTMAYMFDYSSYKRGEDFGDNIPDKNKNECHTETNKLYKYLNPGERGIKECGAHIELEHKNILPRVGFSGCDNGHREHVHLNQDTLVIDYSKQVAKNISNKPQHSNYEFTYAVFAYSGYRFVDYLTETPPDLTNGNYVSPLYQSLEFIKEPKPNFSIDKWLMTSLLKRSYVRDNNITNKMNTYENTVKRFAQSISKIVGFDFDFVLDDSLKYIKLLYNEEKIDFDVIPDGLKSLISWLGDLLMRLDSLNWKGDIPVFERNIILFLDEIENHLHIKWQRKVLPVIQELLPNAQIFITTHSPFILNSTDGVWIHKINFKNGTSTIEKPVKSDSGNSYILETLRTLEVDSEYGQEAQMQLDEFYAFKEKILNDELYDKKAFSELLQALNKRSPSINNEVQIQLNKLKDYLDLAVLHD